MKYIIAVHAGDHWERWIPDLPERLQEFDDLAPAIHWSDTLEQESVVIEIDSRGVARTVWSAHPAEVNPILDDLAKAGEVWS